MSLNEKNFDIEKSCEYFENFVKTYRDESCGYYKDYTMETYLLDMLYGIGVSISQDYKMRNGFVQFKKDLIEFLKEEK